MGFKLSSIFSRVKDTHIFVGAKGIRESGMGLVATNTIGEVDDSPQDVGLQQKYNNAYNNYPIVASAIDVTTEQSVQDFYIEGPDSESLMSWLDFINGGELFYQVQKLRLKNGNCWVEWSTKKDKGVILPDNFPPGAPVGYTILPPELMVVWREKNGTVLGYSQEVNGKIVSLWGSTGDPGKDASVENKGKLENITHFKFNALASEKYGTSLIHPALTLLSTKDSMESDMADIVDRYAAPVIHAQLGDETHPATADDITEVSGKLEDIYTNTEYVTSYLVKMNVLGFEGKTMNLDYFYTHVDKNIISALQVPPELIGMGTSNKAESEVKLRSFGRHIKSLQRGLKVEFEDKVLYGLMKVAQENKVVFDYAEEREREIEIDMIRGLVKDGLVTRQKGNDLLPPKYREVLPELLPSPNGQDQTPYQKGSDNIKDNPTDPTMKQKDESGDNQRRVKTDKASTSN